MSSGFTLVSKDELRDRVRTGLVMTEVSSSLELYGEVLVFSFDLRDIISKSRTHHFFTTAPKIMID